MAGLSRRDWKEKIIFIKFFFFFLIIVNFRLYFLFLILLRNDMGRNPGTKQSVKIDDIRVSEQINGEISVYNRRNFLKLQRKVQLRKKQNQQQARKLIEQLIQTIRYPGIPPLFESFIESLLFYRCSHHRSQSRCSHHCSQSRCSHHRSQFNVHDENFIIMFPNTLLKKSRLIE
ncbi:hypothetical protein RCL_jg22532.t2 [Rhizophagus clarus]|uniref:Uncharacterized protein n=1 Tax=Rhizophagus clarus TaxID=94130 RepID=A0A8H3MA51_9GLOM|nr:hypothetical protein RCL_jg22532.t2 [Rhizophagus clarus]